jgi:hypothetical protein
MINAKDLGILNHETAVGDMLMDVRACMESVSVI